MPEPPSAGPSAPHYDAFLSYSRADRAAVRRIQRFLESYRPPNRRSRLKVYLDETDMRGGSLPDNLSVALGQSRALVVCWSDNAARSQWVKAEIAEFRKLGRPGHIVIAHVAGAGPTIKHEALAGLEPIEHDLRNGWIAWFIRSKCKIELLRLISFLTDVEMRLLRNWARRRLLRNALVGIAAALLPVVAVLSVTQPHWEPVTLTHDERPIDAIACEVVDGKLWGAAWYQVVGGTSGANAFFATSADVVAHPDTERHGSGTFPLARRALPGPQVEPNVVGNIRRVLNSLGERLEPGVPKDTIRIAQPRPGHFVSVLPIALTESETEQEERDASISKLPVPETKGAFVVAYKDDSEPKLAEQADLRPPLWKKFAEGRRQTSPARAISVVWQSNDEIWIGVAGERGVVGGLWHSANGGGRWKKIDGFFSVTSLDLITSPDGAEILLVAEESIMHLSDAGMVPSAARMVERAAGDRWVQSSAPPYGSNSEIEICGTLPDGTLTVRVDGTIYQKRSRSLLRSVLDGSGF